MDGTQVSLDYLFFFEYFVLFHCIKNCIHLEQSQFSSATHAPRTVLPYKPHIGSFNRVHNSYGFMSFLFVTSDADKVTCIRETFRELYAAENEARVQRRQRRLQRQHRCVMTLILMGMEANVGAKDPRQFSSLFKLE